MDPDTQTEGEHLDASLSQKLYQRRDPSQTLIHRVVREDFQTFVAEIEAQGRYLSSHVVREFEAFLSCGILANGFMRLKCVGCKHEKLVAFSCKRRGFCSSCGARRMNEQAAFLTDWVIPNAPIRQWVVSFPIPLRFWMAKNSKLLSQILNIVMRVLSREQAKRGVTGALALDLVAWNSLKS